MDKLVQMKHTEAFALIKLSQQEDIQHPNLQLYMFLFDGLDQREGVTLLWASCLVVMDWYKLEGRLVGATFVL